MKIEENKVVSLIYNLEVNGELKDSCDKENPLEFIMGMGYLLPKFEENLLDKSVGDKFDFVLSAAEGYGEFNPQAIVDLPKNIFEIDGVLQEELLVPGNYIPMRNQMGGVIPGKVVEVSEESVKMDFNHELAGQSLHFTGEITAVREATEDELTNGLYGERAMHNCEGECSSCGGGCN